MHTFPIRLFADEITDPVTHARFMKQVPGPKVVAFLGLARNDAGSLTIIFGDSSGPIKDESSTKLVQVGIITDEDGDDAVLLTMQALTEAVGEISADEWHDLARGLAVYLEDDKFTVLVVKGDKQVMISAGLILLTQDEKDQYVPKMVGQSSPLEDLDYTGHIRDFVIGTNDDGLVFAADKEYGYVLSGTQLLINLLGEQELGVGANTAECLDGNTILVRGAKLLLDAELPPVETWAYVVDKDGEKEMVFVGVEDLVPVKKKSFTGDFATGCSMGEEIITVQGTVDEMTGAQTIQIDRFPATTFMAGKTRDKSDGVTHNTI